MTKTCAVFGCQTNLKVKVDGKWVHTGYTTVFKFPYIPKVSGYIDCLLEESSDDSPKTKKDKALTQRWVNCLPNSKGLLIIKSYNGI